MSQEIMTADILEERYDLAMGRIREIAQEPEVPANFAPFFRRTGTFLCLMDEVRQVLKKDEGGLKRYNRAMYEDILPENYGESYGNPDYAVSMLGEEMGRFLCFLYAQLRGVIVYVFEDDAQELAAHLELFVQVHGIIRDSEGLSDKELAESVRYALYWFESDYSDVMVKRRILENLDPEESFMMNVVRYSNLEDPDYLYSCGEYITEDEIETAKALSSLPEDQVREMAHVWVKGLRDAYILGNKDLSKKSTVNLEYHVGFERMVRFAIEEFEELGLSCSAYRYAVNAVNIRSASRRGVTGAVPNPQYDYDHREDCALFMDARFAERKYEVSRTTYAEAADLAAQMAGPAVMETWGETPFDPAVKETAWKLTKEQSEISVELYSKLGRLVNEYMPSEGRSFVIISWPLPGAGRSEGGAGAYTQEELERYRRILAETFRINTLDSDTWRTIQQHLIDALDQGTSVHVKGRGANETDITVALHELPDPQHESLFENCTADMNIPVGEVFTSPKLTGTNGLLHVTGVYLNGLYFRDLKIEFKDGCTAAVSCANFDDSEEGEAYIRENILFHHDSLPLGEFAIGTNTTAYAVSRELQIEKLLPILIAEKTGPHFAVGDTCYAWEEDAVTKNPDGKRLIARENECSAKRKEDPSKAYFNCHTDITIPYEELGLIEVLGENGYKRELIRDGRFVLPGTEALNEPLDELRDRQ